MQPLNAEQIAEVIRSGGLLRWHDGYHKEEWRDGPEPLRPTSMMRLADKSYYVGYICSKEDCRRCKHPISTWSEHLQLIREDGMDLFGHGEEVRIGKNKTEMVLKDQPVFAAYEEEKS